MKIVGIVGTNASKSYNRKLLRFMNKRYRNNVKIEILEVKGLPIFSEDEEIPERIQKMSDKIKEADAVIIGTPEYLRSIPSALKSLLEWFAYTTHPLVHKPVMLVGTSLINTGTENSQIYLRTVLNTNNIEAVVAPANPVMITYADSKFEGENLIDKKEIDNLDNAFKNFMDFAKLINSQEAVVDNTTGASKELEIDVTTGASEK